MKKINMGLIALILAGGAEPVVAQGVGGKEGVNVVTAANDDITTARADSERLQKQLEGARLKLLEHTTEVQNLIVSFKAANSLEARNELFGSIKELMVQISQQTQLIDDYSKALVANAVRIEGLEKKAE